MASWFTAYCTRSMRNVTAADLTAALDAVDFDTVAEGFGIEDEALIERAVSRLEVEPVADSARVRFRIRYRPGKLRPLLVHLWTDSERVRKELAEGSGSTSPIERGEASPESAPHCRPQSRSRPLSWD